MRGWMDGWMDACRGPISIYGLVQAHAPTHLAAPKNKTRWTLQAATQNVNTLPHTREMALTVMVIDLSPCVRRDV